MRGLLKGGWRSLQVELKGIDMRDLWEEGGGVFPVVTGIEEKIERSEGVTGNETALYPFRRYLYTGGLYLLTKEGIISIEDIRDHEGTLDHRI